MKLLQNSYYVMSDWVVFCLLFNHSDKVTQNFSICTTAPPLAIISTVIWRSPCALLSLKIGKMC